RVSACAIVAKTFTAHRDRVGRGVMTPAQIKKIYQRYLPELGKPSFLNRLSWEKLPRYLFPLRRKKSVQFAYPVVSNQRRLCARAGGVPGAGRLLDRQIGIAEKTFAIRFFPIKASSHRDRRATPWQLLLGGRPRHWCVGVGPVPCPMAQADRPRDSA